MTVTEQEKDAIKRTSLKIGGVFATLGVLSMFGANFVRGSADLSIFLFVVGLGLVGVGGLFVVKGAEFGENYLTRKKFSEDNEGIVWVWIVAILTWAIMAIAYFALSIVVYMVLDSVESFGNLPPEYLANLTLTRNVTGWFLIIMTVGIIGWALINSARKVDDTYPSY